MPGPHFLQVRQGVYSDLTGQRYAVLGFGLIPNETPDDWIVICLPVPLIDLPKSAKDFKNLLWQPPSTLWLYPLQAFQEILKWPDGMYRPRFIFQYAPEESFRLYFFLLLCVGLGVIFLAVLLLLVGRATAWTSLHHLASSLKF